MDQFALHTPPPSPNTAPAASITTPGPASVPAGGKCESLKNKNGHLTNLSTMPRAAWKSQLAKLTKI